LVNKNPIIRVRKLSKTFYAYRKEAGFAASIRSLFLRERIGREALREVSLDVGEGEIVGLVGANGAGKTTLVKILAGIIHPDGGEATVLGHTPFLRHPDFQRRIALIMGQKAQLWWDLPPGDSFLLLKEIYQIPYDHYRETLDELAGRLQVRDLLTIQVRKLSLGERMKMELIAALLHNPKVVYLDEPTIGLDLTAQKGIRNFLLEYRERRKPAMILTSHYMEDIERLCERIVILSEGRIVYDGPLKKILNDFVKHKIITVRLKRGIARVPAPIERLGEVVSFDRDFLRIRVERSAVPRAVNGVLRALPVIDLNIEEPDIGSVIEAIMQRRV
jgi:ABC-2 type transport system ATP-binding protein